MDEWEINWGHTDFHMKIKVRNSILLGQITVPASYQSTLHLGVFSNIIFFLQHYIYLWSQKIQISTLISPQIITVFLPSIGTSWKQTNKNGVFLGIPSLNPYMLSSSITPSHCFQIISYYVFWYPPSKAFCSVSNCWLPASSSTLMVTRCITKNLFLQMLYLTFLLVLFMSTILILYMRLCFHSSILPTSIPTYLHFTLF